MAPPPESQNPAEISADKTQPNPAPPVDFDLETFLSEAPPGKTASPPAMPAAARPQPHGPSAAPLAPKQKEAADMFFLMGCNLIVFASSVCIMVLELTASRLIAKHVGNSLYTWTSVIGVVLAGITIGNYLGGWLADRFKPSRILGWLFLCASALCLSVLWLDQRVPHMDRGGLSWPTWVLLVVTGVYLLPSVALGTISPVVASLALSRSLRTGFTVGNVYAWGALGSIVGTFLTGFFLIDTFGTKAIVGLTAGSLGIIAVIVAAGQRVFRAAVFLGWLQFLVIVVLAAAGEKTFFERFFTRIGYMRTIATPRTEALSLVGDWAAFGRELGTELHELGLTLGLRDDETDEYHDESNYSYINVAYSQMDGEPVKYLKLDKLVHSYYSPSNPNALYYDYELVYAAVTENLASQIGKAATVELPDFPERAAIVEQLPNWSHFDPHTQALSTDRPLTPEMRDELLALAPSSAYWKAIEHLQYKTNAPEWGGFESTALEKLPPQTAIPAALDQKLQYDPNRQLINVFGRITDEDFNQLVDAAPAAAFYRAVSRMFERSRNISTLFIGGGGFVFPRWIEAHFPKSERIDVAELDAAVKLADQLQLGLPPDDQTRITTHIGDARNFVDDRLRANHLLEKRGDPPVLYDFAYGDAFNDFSVPWHLTTVEFSRMVRGLLKPHGSYLLNIIEIFPRTVAPLALRGRAEISFPGVLPGGLIDAIPAPDVWTKSPHFSDLQILAAGPEEFRLRYDRVMPAEVRKRLQALTDDARFHVAVDRLYKSTRSVAGLTGPVPRELLDADSLEAASFLRDGDDATWTPCNPPYESIEVFAFKSGSLDPAAPPYEYQLAVRGRMTAELRDRLLNLPAARNDSFRSAVESLYTSSQERREGRFLGRIVNTVAHVFPNVYVFSTFRGQPGNDRDTFVIVCSMIPMNLDGFGPENPHWTAKPFAWTETDPQSGNRTAHGQFTAILGLSEGQLLTDNYAPVDNLLAPVIVQQDD